MLLLKLLHVLVALHENSIVHGSVILDDIFYTSFMEFPSFWLIGLTATTVNADLLRAAQARDVRMALHLAKSLTEDQNGFAYPIVSPLLLKLCSDAEFGKLSALDAFTALESTLSLDTIPYPFRSVSFQKIFGFKVVDRTYSLKSELAALARTYFIGEPGNMLRHTRQ